MNVWKNMIVIHVGDQVFGKISQFLQIMVHVVMHIKKNHKMSKIVNIVVMMIIGLKCWKVMYLQQQDNYQLHLHNVMQHQILQFHQQMKRKQCIIEQHLIHWVLTTRMFNIISNTCKLWWFNSCTWKKLQ